VAGLDSGFLGPAALNRAFALVSDSRDGSTKQRLQVVASEKGLWRCHTIFECTAVCPKGIPITAAIQSLKRKVMFSKLKRLIGLGG
jgi:succinate dehydrogenase/fumarate reductase-like Fe-S protein